MAARRLTAFVALLAVPSHALVPLAARAPAHLRPSKVARLAPVQLMSEDEVAKAPSTGLIARRLPILSWAPKLTSARIIGDVIAGLTVATVLIPQGMSYATVAGLNPIVGLYCYVPLLVYAAMGTSSFVSVGPVALVSTTLHGMIAGVPDPATRLALASCLMFWGGVLSVAVGLLNWGKVVDVVPHDVLSAFTTSAVLNIMFTQIGNLFQIKVASSHAPILMLRNALVAMPTAKPFTACFSAAAMAMLIAMKKLPLHSWLRAPKSVPPAIFGSIGPFVTMALFTAINAAFGLTGRFGLQEVGIVPSGLPKFTPAITHPLLTAHIKDVAVIAFVMLTETLAMGKALAARAGQAVDNSQEFVAMGVANIAGSFFKTYTSAGSFSRSAVVVSTGGSSQLAGIVTAASVMLTLTFFTPYFTHVPKSVLASALIVAVSGLVDVARLKTLWKESKFTFGLYMFYMALMLSLGAAEGLMASVVVYYLARLVGAPIAEIDRPPGRSGLLRPAIFEKLMASTPQALKFWDDKCDDDGICGVETFDDEA